jgi:hypothetical protein
MLFDNLRDRKNSEAAGASPEAIEISRAKSRRFPPAACDHAYFPQTLPAICSVNPFDSQAADYAAADLIDTNYVDNNDDVNMICVKNFARV